MQLKSSFPSGASGKKHTCNAGDMRKVGLIAESGRPPEEELTPTPVSCLRIP